MRRLVGALLYLSAWAIAGARALDMPSIPFPTPFGAISSSASNVCALAFNVRNVSMGKRSRLVAVVKKGLGRLRHDLKSHWNGIGVEIARQFHGIVCKTERQKRVAREFVASALSRALHPHDNQPSTDLQHAIGRLRGDIDYAMQYLSKEDIWEYLNKDGDIEVWKAAGPKWPWGTDDDKRWNCLKGTVRIDASPKDLRRLLLDSEKAKLLNRYSLGRTDVDVINPHCKVVWTRSKLPYTLKPFDFCSIMYDFTDRKGNVIIVSKAVEHSHLPPSPSFARSQIIFSLNVLSPVPNNPGATDYISIGHVKYSGIHPYLVARSGFAGTANYLKHLREVAPSVIKEFFNR
jgi:START domain